MDRRSYPYGDWPEEYKHDPYRYYARILEEQPDPPRDVSSWAVLKAQFSSIDVWLVVVMGAVVSIFFAIITLTGREDAVHKLIYGALLVGSGIMCMLLPVLISQRMTKGLRYGVRAEAHVVRGRWKRGYWATARVCLGDEVVEREAVANEHYSWIKDVSPKDLIEVLADPASGVPVLFLGVKSRETSITPSWIGRGLHHNTGFVVLLILVGAIVRSLIRWLHKIMKGIVGT